MTPQRSPALLCESLSNDRSVELLLSRLHFLHGSRNGRYTFFGANKPEAGDQSLVALFSRCLLDNSITIVSQAPCPFSNNDSLDARMGVWPSTPPEIRRLPCHVRLPRRTMRVSRWW